MKRNGGNNAYYSVKEVSLKSLHTVWFQIYNILEKAKLRDSKKKKKKKEKKSVAIRCLKWERAKDAAEGIFRAVTVFYIIP